MSVEDELQGFSPSGGLFSLAVSGFELAREWNGERTFSPTKADTAQISLRAQATCEPLQIIGSRSEVTDLSVKINKSGTEESVASYWKHYSFLNDKHHGKSDTVGLRFFNETLDIHERTPPTARLTPDKDNVWHISIDLHPDLFDQTVADLLEGRLHSAVFEVKWAISLTQDRFSNRRWGLYRLYEDDEDAQSLTGFVESVKWQLNDIGLAGDAETSQSGWATNTTRRLQKAATQELETEPDGESDPEESKERRRQEFFLLRQKTLSRTLAHTVSQFTARDDKSYPKAQARYDNGQTFLANLDFALNQEDGPFAKERYVMWRHRDIAGYFQSIGSSVRNKGVQIDELRNRVREYLESPWLHDTHLTWLLLDAFTFAIIAATTESALSAKHGFGYVVTNGKSWVLSIWALFRPILYIAGWVIPAVILIWISTMSVPTALAIGIPYFGLKLLGTAHWLFWRVSLLLTGEKTPTATVAKLITDAERAYASISVEPLHAGAVKAAYERAASNGVNWEGSVYHLLDLLDAQQERERERLRKILG